jgi:hypothetical protein
MKAIVKQLMIGAATAALTIASGSSLASSHLDAPLITLDDAANTTDVYAFVDEDGGEKSLVVALGVYPFEDPSNGPNKVNFDPNVLYEIHVALGDDVAAGRKTLSYQFRFNNRFKNKRTALHSYLGVINDIDDANQNLTQTYTVTKVDHRTGEDTVLGRRLLVPPNNQGIATPFYNQGDSGANPANPGVATEAELDKYTKQAIFELRRGYKSFAGQRDDGFYADIRAIFDLLQLTNPGKDNQGGFNLHLMALEIPIAELDGDQQIAGVYATTSRQQVTVLSEDRSPRRSGDFVQVARQGNPLFNEGLVAIKDQDLYSRTSPTEDRSLFRKYALRPELARLINLLVIPGSGLNPAVETDRTDIAAIYIPDLIKVDLSTSGVRFAGNGTPSGTNPDDAGFSRLSVFGGDTLASTIQAGLPGFPPGTIPGGWPNGRRFGDDVVDIAVTALISDLRGDPLIIQGPAGDNVNFNDMAFNKVFPYESTPQNGRNHAHHGAAL